MLNHLPAVLNHLPAVLTIHSAYATSLMTMLPFSLAIITSRPSHLVVGWREDRNTTLAASLGDVRQFSSGLHLSPALQLVSSFLLNVNNPSLRNNSQLHLLLLLNGAMSDVVASNTQLKTIRSQHDDVVVTAISTTEAARMQAQLLASSGESDVAQIVNASALSAATMAERVLASANCSELQDPCAYNLLAPSSGARPTTVSSTFVFTGMSRLEVQTPLPVLTAPFTLSFDLTLPAATAGYLVAKMTRVGTRYWSVYLSTETKQLTWFYQISGGTGRSLHAPAALLLDGRPHRLQLEARNGNMTIRVDNTIVLASTMLGESINAWT